MKKNSRLPKRVKRRLGEKLGFIRNSELTAGISRGKTNAGGVKIRKVEDSLEFWIKSGICWGMVGRSSEILSKQ